MRTVDIPGGNAEVREKDDLKVRHRQIIQAAAMVASAAIAKIPIDKKTGEADFTRIEEAHLTATETLQLLEVQNASLLAMLVSWTIDDPLPRSIDDVGEMDPDVYADLVEAIKVDAAAAAVETSFKPVDPKSEGFEQSPTHPSGDSSDGLREAGESESTSEPSSSTESSGTEPLSED